MTMKERYTFREEGENISNLEIFIRISGDCLNGCADIKSKQICAEHDRRYAELIEKITALDKQLLKAGGTLEEVYGKLDLSKLQEPVEFSKEQISALITVFDSKNLQMSEDEFELVVNNEIALANLEKIHSQLMSLYVTREWMLI